MNFLNITFKITQQKIKEQLVLTKFSKITFNNNILKEYNIIDINSYKRKDYNIINMLENST